MSIKKIPSQQVVPQIGLQGQAPATTTPAQVSAPGNQLAAQLQVNQFEAGAAQAGVPAPNLDTASQAGATSLARLMMGDAGQHEEPMIAVNPFPMFTGGDTGQVGTTPTPEVTTQTGQSAPEGPMIAVNPFPMVTGEEPAVTGQTSQSDEPMIAVNPFPMFTGGETGQVGTTPTPEVTGQTGQTGETGQVAPEGPMIAVNPFPMFTGGQTEQPEGPMIAINPIPDSTGQSR